MKQSEPPYSPATCQRTCGRRCLWLCNTHTHTHNLAPSGALHREWRKVIKEQEESEQEEKNLAAEADAARMAEAAERQGVSEPSMERVFLREPG